MERKIKEGYDKSVADWETDRMTGSLNDRRDRYTQTNRHNTEVIFFLYQVNTE